MSAHVDNRKKRRRMKKFVITELSAVDRPASEGALVTIMKRDDTDDGIEKVLPKPQRGESRSDFVSRFMGSAAMRKDFPQRDQRLAVANRQFRVKKNDEDIDKSRDSIPVLTSADDGHSHIVWVTGSRGGETTMQRGPDDDGMHDHPWVIQADGSLVIGENNGHTHVVTPDSVLAAMRSMFIAEEDATEAVADVVFAQHADGPPVDLEDFDDEDLPDLVVKSWLTEEFPIRCESDLHNAIGAWDHAEDQDRVAGYIAKRAQALGLDDELPTDGEFAEAIKKTAGPAGGSREEEPKMAKTPSKTVVDKTVEDPDAEELLKVRAELEVSKAFGELDDAQRAYHKDLSEEDATAFLKMSSEDRQAAIEEAKAKVDVVFKSADGTEYTNADDPRLVAAAKSADDSAKQVAGMKALTKNAEYQKRAASELSNLPGEDPVKKAFLKAIDTIEDEDTRKSALEIVKAANDKLAAAFVKSGTRAGVSSTATDSDEADEKLNQLAKAYQLEHADVNFFDAYERVGEANPELLTQAVNR